MMRLFTSIRPPRTIRGDLIDLMHGAEGARWQTDDQLHITLRYIGETNPAQLGDIVDALGKVDFQPFSIALKGIGVFERKGRVEQLWIGVTPVEAITRLHHRINTALSHAGLPPDMRKYTPHCTLARCSKSADVRHFIIQNNILSITSFKVSEYFLCQSHLGKSGASYEAIASFPFHRHSDAR